MTSPVDLRPDHLEIVQDILREHLPVGVKVWVFGSRANWTTKDSSDLDIALECETRISRKLLGAMKDAFEDSILPFRVDIVDVNRIGDSFKRIVESHSVPLPLDGDMTLQLTCSVGSLTDGPAGGIAALTIPSVAWREVPLGEISHRVTKGTTPTTIGGRFTVTGVAFVKVESITNEGRIDVTKLAHIDDETNDLLARSSLQKDDVLFTIAGTIGRVARVREDILPANTNQAVAIVRPNRSTVDPEFLYYSLRDDARIKRAHTRVVQSVQANFSLSELSAVEIPLPPLPEQRAIAHVLGTLDDKIELNWRMNETLEQMARALFKSWFVDFDPVRAKMDGRWRPGQSLPGLPAYLYDLFPSRLVASELGEVPEGWEVRPLPELIEVNPKRTLRRGEIAPYLDMANMPTSGHVPDSVIDRPFGSGMRFANGDTLIARITPCLENGKTAYVDFLRDDEIGWGSTEYLVMKPIPPLPDEFAYCLARSARFREFAIQNMTGTSGRQRVPAKALSGLSLPSPPARIAIEFGSIAQQVFERATRSAHEARTLAAQRDGLLPKLISGELRV